MPIGVPRIIYCWGEELPAQWTDIYNFIFRRRMVFLMQYLDDELCNQICGLLINIHMEDRSKELEKKEIEKSSLFKSGSKNAKPNTGDNVGGPVSSSMQNQKNIGVSFEDLLAADEDLGIQDNNTLEQYTLQKITMEWLNWNAQFFDYSDEPYLFYLADMLSKDFQKGQGQMLYSPNNEAWNKTNFSNNEGKTISPLMQFFEKFSYNNNLKSNSLNASTEGRGQLYKKNHLDVYSPFRFLANFAAQDSNFKSLNPLAYSCSNEVDKTDESIKRELFQLFNSTSLLRKKGGNNQNMSKLLTELAQKSFAGKTNSKDTLLKTSEKALSQRILKKEYTQEKGKTFKSYNRKDPPTSFASQNPKSESLNYLDFYSYNDSYNEFRNTQRGKQTERALQEEESKKVFVIINSFGGSVGNGITVHDALQFIKAGSLTLGLGVAASAASLALAGGTIGERYVTEGCHVMIHQPESSIQGQASDIWIDSQEIMKIRLDVAEIYSLATYRPRHKILRDLDRDFYLTATETIHYGLADEIASNEVMKSIIEMTSKVWDYHDTKQQRLLETRDTSQSGMDTQSQS
jgi:ATP-dependent Clp protease protease subunit